MKKLTLVLVLTCTVIAGLPTQLAAQTGPPTRMRLMNPTNAQLDARRFELAPGIEFKMRDYVRATSFTIRPGLENVFNRNFRAQFLTKAPQYTEEVVESRSRDSIRIIRTLVLDLKDPCDPALAAEGISLCLRPANKTTRLMGVNDRKRKKLTQKEVNDLKTGLNEVRGKLRKGMKSGQRGAKGLQRLLTMNDTQLLDQVYNKLSKQKIITHETVIPLVLYQFGMAPTLDLTNPRIGALPRKGVYSDQGGNTVIAEVRPKLMVLALPPKPAGPKGPFKFNYKNSYKFKLILGETWGKNFGDTYTVQFAPETWFTDRYYASFSWNFSAGFGLRWPFEVTATTKIVKVYSGANNKLTKYPAMELCKEVSKAGNASQCAAQAQVSVKAKPLNANKQFYKKAGVPKDKLFGGKEFVFKAGVTCKLYASIPGPNITLRCPRSLRGFDLSRDFSSQLGTAKEEDLFDYDLPRNLSPGIDVGIGYALIVPGMVMRAYKGKLQFALANKRSNRAKKRVILTKPNTPSKFKVSEDVRRDLQTWGVKLKDPTYRVGVKVVPRVGAVVGIDLGIATWSHPFGPFDLDALSMNLGTYKFTRHKGTPKTYVIDIGQRRERTTVDFMRCKQATRQLDKANAKINAARRALNRCTSQYPIERDQYGIATRVPDPAQICPSQAKRMEEAKAAEQKAQQRMRKGGC